VPVSALAAFGFLILKDMFLIVFDVWQTYHIASRYIAYHVKQVISYHFFSPFDRSNGSASHSSKSALSACLPCAYQCVRLSKKQSKQAKQAKQINKLKKLKKERQSKIKAKLNI